MNFSATMKECRENAGLTQPELAKATGIHQANISRWENNERTPSIEHCAILADYYGITIDDLVGHEIKKNWIKEG